MRDILLCWLWLAFPHAAAHRSLRADLLTFPTAKSGHRLESSRLGSRLVTHPNFEAFPGNLQATVDSFTQWKRRVPGMFGVVLGYSCSWRNECQNRFGLNELLDHNAKNPQNNIKQTNKKPAHGGVFVCVCFIIFRGSGERHLQLDATDGDPRLPSAYFTKSLIFWSSSYLYNAF